MRKGTPLERFTVYAVGLIAYGVAYCWGASFIPLQNTCIPLEWLPILGGLLVAFVVMVGTVSLMMRRK